MCLSLFIKLSPIAILQIMSLGLTECVHIVPMLCVPRSDVCPSVVTITTECWLSWRSCWASIGSSGAGAGWQGSVVSRLLEPGQGGGEGLVVCGQNSLVTGLESLENTQKPKLTSRIKLTNTIITGMFFLRHLIHQFKCHDCIKKHHLEIGFLKKTDRQG